MPSSGEPSQPSSSCEPSEPSEPSCRLLELSHDEVGVVGTELCDALRPLLAVHLSSTAKGLRAAMGPLLLRLKQRHVEATVLAALCGKKRLEQLRDATYLFLGSQSQRPLTLAHWRTLGDLARGASLQNLRWISLEGSDNGDEGVALLGAGLRESRRGLPCLCHLSLENAHIGPQGAAALATGLTERAVPSLTILSLCDNQIGDAGLAALANVLSQLPILQQLYLIKNQITDRGLASLLAPPAARRLASLEFFYLNDNQITDKGCAALVAAIRSTVLPLLTKILLSDNPASGPAQQAVTSAVASRLEASGSR